VSPVPLRARWLGRVPYGEALVLQRALFDHGTGQHLLLLEHPSVYTLGVRADPANVLVDVATVGATLVSTDRGGDVTYHGPGQLVGYPVLTLPTKRGGGLADTVAYVTSVEQLLIDTLADLGLSGAGRLRGFPGVWVDPGSDRPRKIAAIGVKLNRNRTMHGFALNVDPDLGMFDHIVPCGIAGKAVTSLAAEGIITSMHHVVDVIVERAAALWGGDGLDRADVAWRHRPSDLSSFSRNGSGEAVRLRGRLAEAGVSGGLHLARKPEWMRVKLRTGPEFLRVRRAVREHGLATVCEEAGCPNMAECWNDGTATFMVLGDRCTRACGFCLVDTRRPLEVDRSEPERLANAVARLDLAHVVITMVARDDLADGGMTEVARCVEAVRARCPDTAIETLVSDAGGDIDALAVLFAARPSVFNHNLETVARLQRAVRPSAGYARSLAVLAAAKAAGLTTKSGLIAGMGETFAELQGALADLAGVGVEIVTIGQYLQPSAAHLPVARWVDPAEFSALAAFGRDLGIRHVESAPLVRSSYHARSAATPVLPQQLLHRVGP
jgi:lipoyl synthase